MPYSDLCIKCLHPMDRHTYVVARTDGKEVRRCEIGMCACVVMAPSR
jgi:hypothetical protein